MFELYPNVFEMGSWLCQGLDTLGRESIYCISSLACVCARACVWTYQWQWSYSLHSKLYVVWLCNSKFDQLSYLKIYAKYYFCCGLLYEYKFFKNDLSLTMFAHFFWIRRVVKFGIKKIKQPIIWNGWSTHFSKRT